MSKPQINSKRLRATLGGVNDFGLNAATGGINRLGFGDADFAARRWLMEEMRKRGMAVRMDGVGNVFGRFGPADGPCVMCGSHLDSVPEGGKYDGVLGVIAAFECVRALQDAGVQPYIALEVVATAEEEGRFGGMLGSQAIADIVDESWLENSKDADGIALKDAMRAQSLDYRSALGGCRRRDVKAFVELHIEQGPVLEQKGLAVGTVTGISGTSNPLFTLKGEANHSGTTPMELRRDAVMGFCEIGAAIPSILKQHGSPDARMTVGKVDVQPNFPHTVAGEVCFSVNIRDNDEQCMQAMDDAFATMAAEVAARHGLELSVDRRLGKLAPVRLDPRLRAVLEDEARALFKGQPGRWQPMPSGAGHDAQNMQQICPAAMIFIPSRKGISHAVEEFTDDSQVEVGVQLLCNFLHRLVTDRQALSNTTSRL